LSSYVKRNRKTDTPIRAPELKYAAKRPMRQHKMLQPGVRKHPQEKANNLGKKKNQT
jgi:hypothetical protein